MRCVLIARALVAAWKQTNPLKLVKFVFLPLLPDKRKKSDSPMGLPNLQTTLLPFLVLLLIALWKKLTSWCMAHEVNLSDVAKQIAALST